MSPPVLLVAHSMKRLRTILLTMSALLCAFQVVLVAVAASVERSGAFTQIGALMPPFVRELLGPSIAMFLSFAGIVCLGYFHVAVMGALTGLAISVATVPASEIETGFMDLILAKPLARHWIVTRSVIAGAISIAAVVCAMLLGTWLGLTALAPRGAAGPPAKMLGSLALNLALLVLSWNGVTLAIAAASRRRSVAGGVSGVLALTAFLLDYVGRLWSPAAAMAKFSPFHYFNPLDLITGGDLPAKSVYALLAIALAGYAVAYALFRRRDV